MKLAASAVGRRSGLLLALLAGSLLRADDTVGLRLRTAYAERIELAPETICAVDKVGGQTVVTLLDGSRLSGECLNPEAAAAAGATTGASPQTPATTDLARLANGDILYGAAATVFIAATESQPAIPLPPARIARAFFRGDGRPPLLLTAAGEPVTATLPDNRLIFVLHAGPRLTIDATLLHSITYRNPSATDAGAPATLTNSIGMRLRRLEPGVYDRGADDGEDNERPVHTVVITAPFYLGTTEVTRAEWLAVMGDGEPQVTASALPVSDISWHDAAAFCRRLNAAEVEAKTLPEGMAYRLPTEAEWEYACRAGTTGAFTFGDDPDQLDMHAWHAANSAGTAHAVGTKAANAWGLYDMHGNLWEWCSDWDSAYAAGMVVNPQGPAHGSSKIIRSSAWLLPAPHCRCAVRSGHAPKFHAGFVGFRVALGPAASQDR